MFTLPSCKNLIRVLEGRAFGNFPLTFPYTLGRYVIVIVVRYKCFRSASMGQDKIWLHCIASVSVQIAFSCLYLAGVGFYMLAYELDRTVERNRPQDCVSYHTQSYEVRFAYSTLPQTPITHNYNNYLL